MRIRNRASTLTTEPYGVPDVLVSITGTPGVACLTSHVRAVCLRVISHNVRPKGVVQLLTSRSPYQPENILKTSCASSAHPASIRPLCYHGESWEDTHDGIGDFCSRWRGPVLGLRYVLMSRRFSRCAENYPERDICLDPDNPESHLTVSPSPHSNTAERRMPILGWDIEVDQVNDEA